MSSNDPLIGKQLGDYLIQEMLGQGGMARVYRGYDQRLDRHAAVKVIEPHLISSDDDDEYRERFLREARAIAKLNHNNIVSVFQFGESEDKSLYYMAMGFLDGSDLRQILKEYQKRSELMPHDRVLSIANDIAQALDYAHQQNVIHRDVKPSNIMVTPDGRAVLTDFGLALNTQEGTIGNTFGSVHYIAPEQAVSSAQAVDQSDLYSLGVVLYEMLTGRVPFDDISAMSVALKHISDPPPMPSSLNPEITSYVEKVLLRALDKDPENRYPTGKQFVQALSNALEGVTEIPKESTPEIQLMPKLPHGELLEDSPTLAEVTNRLPLTREAKAPEPRKRSALPVIGAAVILIAIVLGALLLALRDDDPQSTPTLTSAAASSSVEPLDTAAPTSTETDEPSTATPTVSNSPTASNTATPDVEETPTPDLTAGAALAAVPIDAESDDDPQILLRYDGRSLVLYNRSPGRSVNVGNLTFERGSVRFAATEWDTTDIFNLRARDCLQVMTIRFTTLPADEPPADICLFRQAFYSTVSAFWVASDPEATFSVVRGGQVVGECPTARRDSPDEYRCVVDIRIDDE